MIVESNSLMTSTRELNSHVDIFLRDLSAHQSDFDTEYMISIQGRQKLITWLEEQIFGTLHRTELAG